MRISRARLGCVPGECVIGVSLPFPLGEDINELKGVTGRSPRVNPLHIGSDIRGTIRFRWIPMIGLGFLV